MDAQSNAPDSTSAFGPKAEVNQMRSELPLIAISRLTPKLADGRHVTYQLAWFVAPRILIREILRRIVDLWTRPESM